MAVSVTKADGTRQVFMREKVIWTCLRLGASRDIAEDIVRKVEEKIYDGIETKKILQMIFRFLSKRRAAIKHMIDLRRALSLIKPQPNFEQYIQLLLREQGYEVTPNQIIQGKCVEHEVDAIARKDGKTYIVEVKHHANHHTPTGLDEGRIARAVLEDATDAFKLGVSPLQVDNAMIVCNTKLSDHAKRYTRCRGIHHLCWGSPPEHNLQTIIDAHKLYPITCLKGVRNDERTRLASAGVLLLKQLITHDAEDLSQQTGIPREALVQLTKKARMILEDQ
jgi:hypothetical protein